MKDEASDRLEAALKAILRLLAVQSVEGKSLTESAQLLDRAGIDRKVIADVCETTPESIRGLLSQARRKQAQTTKKKKRTA